jgi:uncharacterized protein YhdP
MTNNTDLPIVTPTPSRWWRGYAWCVRVLWWLALSAWGLVAVAALALHFWIVPRVLDWKSDIEAMASQALGVKVSIGNLDTLSTDWLPSLEITDFVLRNAEEEEVLRLPRVLVSLSPTSLLTLSLDRVDIDSPLIEVTRDSDGQLRIAGLSMGQAQPSALADWFWSQPEIFVHRGRLRWVDQKASLPAVELQEVNVALRNGLRSHDWRIDATPPPEWGARFSLQGRFHQPLLSRHPSDLQAWDGEVYAAFSHIDLAPIQPYLSFVLGDALQTGQGWLRGWAQVRRGRLVAQTVDVDMQALRWQANETAPAVLLQQVQGRLHHQAWLEGLGQDIRSQDLALRFEDGEEWSLGSSRVAWRDEGEHVADAGELQLQAFSLEMLARIAQRLPLGESWQARLAMAQPKGQVKQLEMRWFLAHSDAPQFNLKTEVTGLSLQAPSSVAKPDSALWWPGIQSSQLKLEVSEHGGKVHWQQAGGHLQIGEVT